MLWATGCGGTPEPQDDVGRGALPGAQRSQDSVTQGSGAEQPDADGLWLIIVNGLPVHAGAGGEIIAQTFLECAIEASVGARTDQAGQTRRSPVSRLELGAKIMARRSAVFHLTPAEVERLRASGGGTAWLRVRDPLQAGGLGPRCDMPVQLRPVAAGEPQRLRVVVETRLNDAWGCEVTET